MHDCSINTVGPGNKRTEFFTQECGVRQVVA